MIFLAISFRLTVPTSNCRRTRSANYRALEQSSEEMVARETAKMDARLNKTMDEMSEMHSKLTGYATKLENMGIDPGTACNFHCIEFCYAVTDAAQMVVLNCCV